MKRDKYEQWLAELRNPANAQAQEVLKDKSGARCCLGVLADLYGVENEPEEFDGCYRYDFKVRGVDPRKGFPPDQWMDDIGLGRVLGMRLAHMNDDGRTFMQIAEEIEFRAKEGELKLED